MSDPNEIVWRLPKAQANLVMALLTSHPYNQVADLLHQLQHQLNNQPPAPGQLSTSPASPDTGSSG